MASVMLDLEAILRAIAAVAVLMSSGLTTRLTSPISAARAAGVMSPVRSISIACLLATFRDRATIGVKQNSPICTPGVLKLAVNATIARSQLATSGQPAAVAMPVTWPMRGPTGACG